MNFYDKNTVKMRRQGELKADYILQDMIINQEHISTERIQNERDRKERGT